jgi:hypothetical protein
MVFLHIDTKNYNVKEDKAETPIQVLNNFIATGKKVFALIYMEGCGPCNSTRPEWGKIKHILKKNDMDFLVVDIDKDLISKVKNIGLPPRGFPTIRFISNKGKTIEDFEDCKLSEEYKNRTIDSFVKWIQFKLHKPRHKSTNKRRHKKIQKQMGGKQMGEKPTGGKWSLKYKRSIHCQRPKGFSQKQYCRYTRKRH